MNGDTPLSEPMILYITTVEMPMGEMEPQHTVILGSYGSLEEAESSIDRNSTLLTRGQNGRLCLYAVPMQQFRIKQYSVDDEKMQNAIKKVTVERNLLDTLAVASAPGHELHAKSIGKIIEDTVRATIRDTPANSITLTRIMEGGEQKESIIEVPDQKTETETKQKLQESPKEEVRLQDTTNKDETLSKSEEIILPPDVKPEQQRWYFPRQW